MGKLVYGVGVSEAGEFARSICDGAGNAMNTREYQTWYNMLKRCYSKKFHLCNPTYIGCSVSKNLLNFQYFAKWCQTQLGFKEGWDLDKDLISSGNKVYSEDTCVFIPRRLNTFLVSCKASRGLYPIGVSNNKNSGRFESRVQGGKGKNIRLGYFNTPEEAFQAYKLTKEAMAKELALEYEGLVDPRIITALNNFTVNIND